MKRSITVAALYNSLTRNQF